MGKERRKHFLVLCNQAGGREVETAVGGRIELAVTYGNERWMIVEKAGCSFAAEQGGS